MMTEKLVCLGVAVLLQNAAYSMAAAQDAPQPADQPAAEAADQAPDQAGATAKPKGILSIPDYTGDIGSRKALTGDWNGTRAKLADNGVQIELTWNQYVQDVASGGRGGDTRYGGKGDYLFNFDFDRMGLVPGGQLTIRAESRYGESINNQSGLLLPVNTDAYFPMTDETDEDIAITVTTVKYTQYLSEHFGVFFGKMDTLDGDPNEFASGRGTSQFMNSNFVFNPSLALRLPYSTLGIGASWFPNEHFTITALVFNTADSSTTTGFDDFGDGTSVSLEADFKYRLGDLPGGMNIGALYSFDQDFAKISDRLVFEPGQGLVIPTEDETWAVYWSGWQYLFTETNSDAPINLADGRPDHQGIGLFARFGYADRDTNPIDWSASVGIGGRGLFPSRDDDTYGVGYFYNSLKRSFITDLPNVEDYSQGAEIYYAFAITPAVQLTLDAQYIDSADADVDNALLLGMRLGIDF